MSEKTIALSGAEIKVEYGGGTNAWLRNDGAAVVYASKTAGVAAGADGVVSILSGQSAPVYGANGTVFLLGAGSVQLIGSDYSTNPFAGDSSGGGAGTSTNAAGIVTLDGLQGGVPFSGITLDGDIVGQEITIRAGGENLLKFGSRSETETISGVTFTRSPDGTITANGTATAVAQYLSDVVAMTDGETYTLTGCPAGGSTAGFSMTDQTTASITDIGAGKTFVYSSAVTPRFKIRIAAGYTCNNLVFRPVLCAGTAVITKITPDSAPFVVTDDIRQRDGVNTVSVSAGNVAVTGARRNAALGKIWGKLDELTAAVIVANGEV